jgi:hypothetical protein
MTTNHFQHNGAGAGENSTASAIAGTGPSFGPQVLSKGTVANSTESIPLNNVDELLRLDAAQLRNRENWHKMDRIVCAVPSNAEKIRVWEQVCVILDKNHSIKGLPLFRLGILHLLEDADEPQGLTLLEQAYHEDKREKEQKEIDVPAERRGAYLLLAVVKDFFDYLRAKKPHEWESGLLTSHNRKLLVLVLFTVYDLIGVHALDMQTFTIADLQKLIKSDALRRFAGENYFCTQNLLEMFTLQRQNIDKVNDQYPLARAIIGLVGGVLEAIWVDRMPPSVMGKTLGTILTEAHKQGILKLDTRIAALSSLLLFMRNHVHPGRDIKRQRYFINMDVAKGCKAALDWTISELLRTP